MDPRLLEAAQKGNIDELNDLIGSNRLILEETALEGAGQTPLHVACMAGHLDFVREILKLMPKFAEKLNTDGYSPLHIAAARGDIEITKELLKVGQRLCSVKGRKRRIPLHYAIINAELYVMDELLSASPDSVEERTAQEETALHLAVKNNRYDVVVKLVEHLKKYNKAPVINRKDDEGNTALHLAVFNKNFEVVEILLRQQLVDVNASNKSGRTPLDLEAGDRKIREILTKAGARHGTKRSISPSSSLVLEVGQSDGDALALLSHSQSKILKTERESMGDIRNALLVVAALIASATYQAVLQPPSFKTKVDNSSTKGLLASYVSWMTDSLGGDLAYVAFITGNTFGLLVSVQMIICLTRDLPFKLPLLLSVAAKVQTYCCYTYYLPFTLLDREFGLKNVELLSVLPLIISVILLLTQRRLALLLDLCVGWLFRCDHLRGMYSLRT